MNKNLWTILFVILVIAGGAWLWKAKPSQPNQPNQPQPVIYTNAQYGFSFDLPETWRGFTVVTSTWNGETPGARGVVTVERGQEISLRNPTWKANDPTQDIPIMIFTIKQWNDMQADKFHIGAAPINPSELGRNSTYVFGLPARYNYAFPRGYQEVEDILKTNPLHPF